MCLLHIFNSNTTTASYEADLPEITDYLEKGILEIEKEDIQAYYEEMKNKIT